MLPLLMIFSGLSFHLVHAQTGNPQTTNPENISEQIQKLTESMTRTQAQLEQSQRQLDEMRQQLLALQRQMAQTGPQTGSQAGSTATTSAIPNATPASAPETIPPATAAAIDDLREQLAMQQAQIATHEQTKVESESKYPVKITGLLLLNGFANSGQVDMAATPTVSIPGSGSTGASVRQTILGIDLRGPHLFGARSYADLSVDFDGTSQSATSPAVYSGNYSTNASFLRLRTVHAGLQWRKTTAYFSLDRPIFSPNTPTSLTAVAMPALAWSGNLWTWNPQGGVTQDLKFVGSSNLRLQAALIDVGDGYLLPLTSSTNATAAPPSSSEQSRKPGTEARIAVIGSKADEGNHLGFGGYFAPHLSPVGRHFDSWAGTVDTRWLLPANFEFTGSFYRGQALGGLGGGAFKDVVYRVNMDAGGYYFHPLDDVGGWAQLKEKVNERVEFNAALGLDNVTARELRRYAVPGGTVYQNLARNRTYTGNVIYSPSAYLLFSLEYRHLESSPVNGLSSGSNIIGLGAGYKF
ncbi:hypothetical protein [Acidicapsa ligni]|uniref:hypothetical protein n=1 Tax=Acidicapsa ligni TaxID=542300 RepID=UPI0021E08DCA|nr:hypothetical protein [Acidicapsa ligni]